MNITLYLNKDKQVQFIELMVNDKTHFTADFSYFGSALRIGVSKKTVLKDDKFLTNLKNDMDQSDLFSNTTIEVTMDEMIGEEWLIQQLYVTSDNLNNYSFY